MYGLNERASEAVSSGVSAARSLLSVGSEQLKADRATTLKSIETLVGALRGDSELLRRDERLTFSGYDGIKERHELFVTALGELMSHGRALGDTLRPSFSDLREYKHLLAKAMIAAAENLSLNDRKTRDGGSVLAEGYEEKAEALDLIRRAGRSVQEIERGGAAALGAVRSLRAELSASVPQLIDCVRGGQFGINEGIKHAVSDLAAAGAKLLGSLSVIESGEGMGPLDWRKVQADCREFLKASTAPVFRLELDERDGAASYRY